LTVGLDLWKNASDIVRMKVSSEIQAQNEEFLGDIFYKYLNCQIQFFHNLRDLCEVAKLGCKIL